MRSLPAAGTQCGGHVYPISKRTKFDWDSYATRRDSFSKYVQENETDLIGGRADTFIEKRKKQAMSYRCLGYCSS